MTEQNDVDIIKNGLSELLSKEKPILPYYMEDTFKTCLVLGLLFEGLKLGEISNNVVFQLSRLSQMFETKIDFNKGEIKEIVNHFVEIIRNKLKKIGETHGEKEKTGAEENAE